MRADRLSQLLSRKQISRINEQEREPGAACAEYTAALEERPPGEARDALLEARRRVVSVAH